MPVTARKAKPRHERLRAVEQAPINALVQQWLNIQVGMLGSLSRALVMLCEGKPRVAATWACRADDPDELPAIAAEALSQRRITMRRVRSPGIEGMRELLALPIRNDDAIIAVVVLEYPASAGEVQTARVNLLRWGGEWLKFALANNASAGGAEKFQFSARLLAACLDEEHFHAACASLVAELASRFGCERVSIGTLEDRFIKIEAVSHSARFSDQFNLLKALARAMEEAVDQDTTILHNGHGDTRRYVSHAHEQLAAEGDAAVILSVPLCHAGKLCGALCLEWTDRERFEPMMVQMLEQVVAMAGPVLMLKRRDERWLGAKALESLRLALGKVFGPHHYRLKLNLALGLFALLFCSFYRVDYQVMADAELQGSIERVVAAPLDGYISVQNKRAGDLVSAGDLLGALDDRDLRLEKTRVSAERHQYARERQDARSRHDNVQLNILDAQVSQAEARIALIDEQLSRTQLTAPFDGVIIEGDLSQSLGAPVRRGDVLFRIAPLEEYRVVLQVDERDIDDVAVGREGHLVLASFPDRRLPFVVEKIVSVSEPANGGNYFRVEAHLSADTPAELRPGMEGAGKVAVEPRRLIWVLSHTVTDWLGLKLWSLLP